MYDRTGPRIKWKTAEEADVALVIARYIEEGRKYRSMHAAVMAAQLEAIAPARQKRAYVNKPIVERIGRMVDAERMKLQKRKRRTAAEEAARREEAEEALHATQQEGDGIFAPQPAMETARIGADAEPATDTTAPGVGAASTQTQDEPVQLKDDFATQAVVGEALLTLTRAIGLSIGAAFGKAMGEAIAEVIKSIELPSPPALVTRQEAEPVADTRPPTTEPEPPFKPDSTLERIMRVPAPEDRQTKVREDRHGDLPAKLRRPKVVVIGLLPQQSHIINERYRSIEFRFLEARANSKDIEQLTRDSDATYIMTDFISHRVSNHVKAETLIRVGGGLSTLGRLIEHRFDPFNIHQETAGAE